MTTGRFTAQRGRPLLADIQEFLRRCDPEQLRPGEPQIDDEEWDAMVARVDAAVGGAE
jgi:hypothetical protein